MTVGSERGASLTVISPGPLLTVQDLGRPGWAHVGVTRSGAADRGALRLANRLVANAENAPALEVTLGGLSLRTEHRPLLVALTGARCPITINGTAHPDRTLLSLEPGDVLRVGVATAGLRAYLAVRGGLDVALQLGSSATDLLSGLGPAPLAADATVQICFGATSFARGWPVTDVAPAAGPHDLPDVAELAAIPGPRDEVLPADGRAALTGQLWTVMQDSDRIGVRLQGDAVPIRPGAGQVRSEPVVRGAIQLPPGGEPVLFLADHPVTGGYPVVAVLTEAAADRAAQLRPGDRVRLRLLPRPGWAAGPADR